MSDAADTGRLVRTEQAADGTWAGLRQEKKVLGLGWHWWIWIAVIYLNIMDGAVFELWKIGSGLMKANLGWSALSITAVRAYGSWISMGLALVINPIYERYFRDRPKGLMWMFFIQIVGEMTWGIMALFLAPHRYWVLFAMEIPYRILSFFGGIAQYVVIVNWFEKRRGLALGLTGTTGEGGTPMLWGALGGWFMTHYDYRKAWFFTSLFLLPAVPLIAVFVRNWPANVGLLPWGADPTLAHNYSLDESKLRQMSRAERRVHGIPPHQRWGFTLREALRQRSYWILAIASFGCVFTWYFGAYGIGFMAKTVGISVQTVGITMSIYGVWYTLQGAVLGQVFDWRGWDFRYAISWAPLGGISLAGALIFYARSVAGYMIGYMCVAMGVAAWGPMWAAMMAEHYGPLTMGMVRGIVNSFTGSFGSAIGLLVLGWAVDRYGNTYPLNFINIWAGVILMVMFWLATKPSLEALRSIKQPPPWAFAKNAADVRRQPKRTVPVYD